MNFDNWPLSSSYYDLPSYAESLTMHEDNRCVAPVAEGGAETDAPEAAPEYKPPPKSDISTPQDPPRPAKRQIFESAEKAARSHPESPKRQHRGSEPPVIEEPQSTVAPSLATFDLQIRDIPKFIWYQPPSQADQKASRANWAMLQLARACSAAVKVADLGVQVLENESRPDSAPRSVPIQPTPPTIPENYEVPDEEFKTSTIAHRGDREFAPQNTLPAIHSAWEKGVPNVEIDVFLDGDNNVIVTHDVQYEKPGSLRAMVTRPWDVVTGPTSWAWGENLEDLPTGLSTKVDVSRIDEHPSQYKQFAGISPPLLEDVLKAYGSQPDFTLFVELKETSFWFGDHAARNALLGRKVADLLERYVPPEKRWVTSFSEAALDAAGPNVKRMLNVVDINPCTTPTEDFVDTVREVRDKGYDALNTNIDQFPEEKILDATSNQYLEPWRYAAANGVILSTYTLGTSNQMIHSRLPHYNPDYFMTDRPVQMHDMYSKPGASQGWEPAFPSTDAPVVERSAKRPNPLPESRYDYDVQPGDTLSKVRKLFQLDSIQDILDFNKIADPDVIREDKPLIIPIGNGYGVMPAKLAH